MKEIIHTLRILIDMLQDDNIDDDVKIMQLIESLDKVMNELEKLKK